MASELKPCPFCRKPMMLREALWPSEGDTDAIIHADKTDCPMFGFGDGSADGSIVEKWNICSSDDEDDFPSDGSCIRCGSVPRNASGLCNTCLDEDAARLENTRPAPAAPVDGLERYRPEPMSLGGMVRDPDGGYVTRSQAEELLAAERAEKERLADDYQAIREQLFRGWRECQDLKADNAALTARVKKLEKDFYDADKSDLSARDLLNDQDAKIEALEAKLAVAEKALEFYRDGFKYHPKRTSTGINVSEWKPTQTLLDDCGETARAARGGKPS